MKITLITVLLTLLSFSSFAGPANSGDAITAQKFNNQTFGVGDIK